MPQNTKSISDARKRATNKYLQEKVDEIKVRVPKGQKEVVQAHAVSRGESVNSFIGRAISEAMQRDTAAGRPTSAVSASGTVTDNHPNTRNATECSISRLSARNRYP